MKLPSWLSGKKPDEPKPPELPLPKVDPKYEAEQAAAQAKEKLVDDRAKAPERGGAARLLDNDTRLHKERQAQPQPEPVKAQQPSPSQVATQMENKPTPQAAPSPGGMGMGGGYHPRGTKPPEIKAPGQKPPEPKPEVKPPSKSYEEMNHLMDVGGHKKGRRY